MTDLEQNGKMQNDHKAMALSSPDREGSASLLSWLRGSTVFSFLAMVMAIAALAAIASKDVSTTCDMDDTSILEAIKGIPTSDEMPRVMTTSCAAAEEGVRASGLEMVAHAYNNMGANPAKPFPNAERRYEGMASGLKTIGSIQELIVEASDALTRKELVKDGMSGDVNFTHGHFQAILTFGGSVCYVDA
jgi:hypothetical protein